MDVLRELLGNKMIITPALAWVAAQFSKTVIDSLRRHRVNPRLLVGSGGMPSAHSAFACGLSTAVWFTQGAGSAAFAISAAFAAVVMYDAAGVRQAVDRQLRYHPHFMTMFPET